MSAYEINFDGLVGPTHNYAGLSYGNVASIDHALTASNPRAAALQGLHKMKQLADLGLKQAVLPPQERPDVHTLRTLGYDGSDAEVIMRASREMPRVFQACCSASSMWAANAATISPSPDCDDGRVHITPANLSSKFHRSIESEVTARILQAIFPDQARFAHHSALPAGNHFSDEGAANHTRLCTEYGVPGVELFVFGRYAFDTSQQRPTRFPARQTFQASAAIARRHRLNTDKIVLAQQNPEVIDAGVFHNDVIAVGNQNVLLYHASAFADKQTTIEETERKFGLEQLWLIEISDEQVTVAEAVSTYLFNSQLVTLTKGEMAIIVPAECQENDRARLTLDYIVAAENPITQIRYMDVRESMKNGGGPACLRLRVVLTKAELEATNPDVLFDDRLFENLCQWVERHYRDRLSADDLTDPQLLMECRAALDELTQILQIGSVYRFQI